MCAAIASQHTYVDGTNVAAIASSAAAAAYARGSQSAVVACEECSTVVGNAHQFIGASLTSEIDADGGSAMSVARSFVTGNGSHMVASNNAELNKGLALGGGYDGGAAIVKSNANQNLTWIIDSACTGGVTGSADGTWTSTGVDYAEYFPNAEPEIIPTGSLVARVGRNVRMAIPGDRVLGVVSAQPSVIGGDGSLHWSGKYERDLFGGYVFTLDTNGVMSRKLNPDYDPAKEAEYQGRAKRPEEWTCVGLLGQLHVRIDETVTSETYYLEPGTDGRGTATDDETRCEVMEITTPYTKKRGYGVALCLVR